MNSEEDEIKIKSVLIEEEDAPKTADGDAFNEQLERTLKETEQAVLQLQKAAGASDFAKTWPKAMQLVSQFKPVPYFIWRLSNFVLGRPGNVGQVSEGLVFGLRRLMFAMASDELLGAGQKVNSVRKALKIVSGDVVAAVSVMHAISRRLATKEHERIWNPILDDGLLRARIGYQVGINCPEFGAGRGMLAGFAGRSGLAVLIAMGDIDQARKALELLATGRNLKETGLATYECDPLQVSSLLLTAAGIGRDAAFGTVNYAMGQSLKELESLEQKRWLAAFNIIENVRTGSVGEISDGAWDLMNIDKAAQAELLGGVKKVTRRGHGWGWVM